MLLLGSRLKNTPVMSLQTGQELARTSSPVIDPRTLSIIAYELEGHLLNTNPSLLRIADIREMSDIGMIVDSSEEFLAVDDVIKIQEVYNLDFKLIDMPVRDIKGRKIGKVHDYSLEIGNFVIQQLSVKRPLLMSLNDSELLIHRSQIREITDEVIIIESGESKVEPLKEAARNYVNPFRPQTDSAPSGNISLNHR